RLASRCRRRAARPAMRAAHHAFRHEVVARPARAERGIADVLRVARAAERTHAAGLGEAIRAQMHEGETCEWLDGDAAEAHAVTDLAENLALGGVVASACLLGEAGKDDGAAGGDHVPGKGRARTRSEEHTSELQ